MDNNDCHFDLSLFIRDMIFDFEQEYHEVYCVPNRDENKEQDGRHIRVASNRNPEWYRKICAAFPKRKQKRRKKPQTSIKKEDVINVMNTIIRKGYSGSKYTPYILDEARRRMEGEFVPFDGQF
jgi:hypothetical protein